MRIRWADPAVHDFTQICDYLEEHDSVVIARRVALSIYRSISLLAKYPESGRTGRQLKRGSSFFRGSRMLRYTVCA